MKAVEFRTVEEITGLETAETGPKLDVPSSECERLTTNYAARKRLL